MPDKPKKAKPPRIYVGRYTLNGVKLTDDQKAVIAANTVRSWPDDYELFPTDDVKAVLAEVEVGWRENKNEKPKKVEATA